MSDIKWGNPPKRTAGPSGGRLAAIAAELEQRPGEWALVMTDASVGSSQSLRIRYGLEVTVRGQHGTRADQVWARKPI